MRKRAISLLCSSVLLNTACGQDWPGKLAPPRDSANYRVEHQDSSYIYETKSFQLHSFTKHEHTIFSKFTQCIESVPLALQSLPLPLYAPPGKGKPLLYLCPDRKSYRAAGGAENTAGYYDGRKGSVIVNWPVFMNDSVETRLLPEPAFDLIIHEMTHLCMHGLVWKTEAWLSEGVAEYLAAAHLGGGNFDFTKIDHAVRQRVKKHAPPDLKTVRLLKLNALIKLSSEDWLNRTALLQPWETLEAYNAALLLTHYVFHGGMPRRERVRKHLESLQQITSVRQHRPPLFSAEKGDQIEHQLEAYWLKRGLALSFEAP